MPYTLVLNADGTPKLNAKGLPVFTQPGGSEFPVNLAELYDAVRAKNGEAKSHRKEKEALAERLAAAETALEAALQSALHPNPPGADEHSPAGADSTTTSAAPAENGPAQNAQLPQSAAEQTADQASAQTPEQAALEQSDSGLSASVDAEGLSLNNATLAEKDALIHKLLVENVFSASAYLREKTVLPPDIALAALGAQFSVEYRDGRPTVLARDYSGKLIHSANAPDEAAGPEEALKLLVEKHPQRDALLKAPRPDGGSGNLPGRRASRGTPRSLNSCKTEAERIAYLRSRI